MKADMDGTLHPKYPTIDLLVKIGRPLAAVIAMLIALLGIGGFVLGRGLIWPAVGLIGGLVAFVVLRACAEIIEVISDVLLPK